MQEIYSKLSSYQNPEGQLQDRLAPRTDFRLKLINWGWFAKRTVLDIGCNNGYFVREALKNGAVRAVGVDKSDCIVGARELAKKEGIKAEFWQMDVESKEFKRFCPRFDVVILFSAITKLKDKELFLDWLDDKIKYTLIFESNHGEKNKEHIELVKKHIYFDSVEYLGPSEIPSKPHYMWLCKKTSHEMRYPMISYQPVEFVSMDRIVGWEEDKLFNQKTKYGLNSDKFLRLKEDIRQRGIRDPLILEDEKNNYFKGFQGMHRFLAAKQLGYKSVPCRVLRGYHFKHLNK